MTARSSTDTSLLGADADAQSTPSRILECAARLFATQGVSATSMRAIAEEAGVTKPTLYYHFGSKASLINRLVNIGGESIAEELGEDETILAMPIGEALRQILSLEFKFADAHPSIMMLHARMHTMPDGEWDEEMLAESRERHESRLTELFQRAVERGELRSVRLENLVTTFIGMVAFNVFDRVKCRSHCQAPREAARAIVDIFLNGACANKDRC